MSISPSERFDANRQKRGIADGHSMTTCTCSSTMAGKTVDSRSTVVFKKSSLQVSNFFLQVRFDSDRCLPKGKCIPYFKCDVSVLFDGFSEVANSPGRSNVN